MSTIATPPINIPEGLKDMLSPPKSGGTCSAIKYGGKKSRKHSKRTHKNRARKSRKTRGRK
jgi:hypothetical protein